MKSFAVIPLVGIMLATLAMPALAKDTLTDIKSSKTLEVRGQRTSESGTSSIVYSVDIEWGSMYFNYCTTTSQTWNPDLHSYSSASSSSNWYPAAVQEEGALESNVIKVTNHSNTDVTCNFSFIVATWFKEECNGSGTFEHEELLLNTAENTPVDGADSKSTALNITSGNVPDSQDISLLGKVLITLR